MVNCLRRAVAGLGRTATHAAARVASLLRTARGIAVLALMISVPAAAQGVTDAQLRQMEADLLQLVNQDRAANNRAALTRVRELDLAARRYARHMADTLTTASGVRIEGEGTDGLTPEQRTLQAGYEATDASQIVTWGKATAREVHAEWVRGSWVGWTRNARQHVGVGVVYRADAAGRFFWVLVLADPFPTATILDRWEAGVVELVNRERGSRGLSILARAPELDLAALRHSLDMGGKQFTGHTGSDGSNPGDRIAASGFGAFSNAYENVFFTAYWTLPEGVFQSWMNSPGHREAMLHPRPTQVGVAVVYEPKGGYSWTLVLAAGAGDPFYRTSFGPPTNVGALQTRFLQLVNRQRLAYGRPLLAGPVSGNPLAQVIRDWDWKSDRTVTQLRSIDRYFLERWSVQSYRDLVLEPRYTTLGIDLGYAQSIGRRGSTSVEQFTWNQIFAVPR